MLTGGPTMPPSREVEAIPSSRSISTMEFVVVLGAHDVETSERKGTLTVRSEGLGKGSEFVLRLPIMQDDVQESGPEKSADKK